MTEDTRTKTPEEIEAEKNSTMPSEDLNPTPTPMAQPSKVVKATKKRQQLQSRLNTSTVNVEPAARAYFFGELDKNAWSRMSPALKKCIERYIKQHKADLIAEKKKAKEAAEKEVDAVLDEAAKNVKAEVVEAVEE